MGKCHIAVRSNVISVWPLHFIVILRFSPTLILPLVGISVLLAESYGIHPLSQIHSGVINANVSILRLTARCTTGCASMLYEGVYENVRHRGGERKGRSEDPEGCSHIFVSYPRCTGDAPSGACVRICACVLCLCVCVYVAARYYRIILGYFTGTRKASLGRARIASQTIVIRSRERTKGNEREAESSEGFCFAWYDDITRVKGTPESWERIVMNNWDSCTGRRFASSFRDSLLEIYLLIISVFWSVAKVLSIEYHRVLPWRRDRLQLRSFKLISYQYIFFAYSVLS